MITETKTVFIPFKYNPGCTDGFPVKKEHGGPIVGFCGEAAFDPQTSLWMVPVTLKPGIELTELQRQLRITC